MDLNDLTEGQRAKARACSTPGEMLGLAREEGYELIDQELEGVSGGWNTRDANSCSDECKCGGCGTMVF